MNRNILILLMCIFSSAAVVAAESDAGSVDSIVAGVQRRVVANRDYAGEYAGEVYVKQRLSVERHNLGLDLIPGMARLDRGKKEYLAEYIYNVHGRARYMPSIKRIAYIGNHERSSGSMDRVLSYLSPYIFGEKLFSEGYLSPLASQNRRFYNYTLQEAAGGVRRVGFKQRFDNIKLLTEGWFDVDADGNVLRFCINGWDEQCRFEVEYTLNVALVEYARLVMHYDFAGNRLVANVAAHYSYSKVAPMTAELHSSGNHNITLVDSLPEYAEVAKCDYARYISQHRPNPLTPQESAVYEHDTIRQATSKSGDSLLENDVVAWLWNVGDDAVSSHSYDWRNVKVKFSPLINPSYLSYTSSRGLSYKLSMNVGAVFKSRRELAVRPMVGYNFKYKAFYWGGDASFLFAPKRQGCVNLNFGQGNNTYSSVALKNIEEQVKDSLDFDKLRLNYFRNFYFDADVRFEVANGLELLAGVDYYRRTLLGNIPDIVVDGSKLSRRYVQFAPHVRVTWHPGMYYYMKGGRKVNVGSKMPRFSLDVERGVKGVMKSTGNYLRTELDVQWHRRVGQSSMLYMRAGGGGFFHTDNLYFVDYAFLRQNNLPIERSEESGGVFQLLDTRWYNSANKYFRLHLTYESPFLALQKLLPRVNFIKNEYLYFNTLVMSQLRPYCEVGYGVSTPYVNLGIFLGSENFRNCNIGYKIALSLFDN